MANALHSTRAIPVEHVDAAAQELDRDPQALLEAAAA